MSEKKGPSSPEPGETCGYSGCHDEAVVVILLRDAEVALCQKHTNSEWWPRDLWPRVELLIREGMANAN